MRDIDIRRKLRQDKRLHFGEANTRVVEELGLCQGIARIDLAVVNGSIHGYEIKSDRDTLARLNGQVDIYNRTLDFVTIVSAPSHINKIRKIVPRWWGIWTAVTDVSVTRLEVSREPKRNHEIDPFSVAQLLWREEALQALDGLGLATRIRSKPRQELWKRLASELTREELGSIVRDRLRRRCADWRSDQPPA
jgi:hypothetical protein